MSKTLGKNKPVQEQLQHPAGRGAGILLHITSLHSPYGIGDMGNEARAFADFLHRSKQKYWQLLPLNPTEKPQSYSPYSATSSMAGNIMLISPELLAEDGLLNQRDLKQFKINNTGKVDYGQALRIKTALLDKAYAQYRHASPAPLRNQYQRFCNEQSSWLDDFSLYSILKQLHGEKPWYEWKKEYKLRNAMALREISHQHQEEIAKVKWSQFIFDKQWKALRAYCNGLHISLVGDLPFYVSYDSADVWAHPEIFALDKEGNMKGVAGVPPDYFNADGQRWGMPVFRWEVLKKNKYQWWIERLRKNISLFDLIRLDHFRAFSAYWEVKASEKTAKKGQWKQGPGAEFFNLIKEALGHLPFIAEDLGDIDPPVYTLRDQFNFPGMKVLQFAFGDNMPQSDYIPHNFLSDNFIVYTGTHDNNTTCGWFRKDIGKTERKNLSTYLSKKVNDRNIHLELGLLAYASTARIVILPMQDVLGLNESARMNTPASISKNWLWRLQNGQVNNDIAKRLASWTQLYNRE